MSKKWFYFPLFFIFISISCRQPSTHDSKTISISGAFALYPLAVRWSEEFRKLHPEVRINVSAGGSGKGMTDALTDVVDIGMVSRRIYEEEIKRGARYFAVAKDAVVPTVSEKNQVLPALLAQGMKKSMLEGIFINGSVTTWAQAGFSSNLPLHVYTRSDAAGAAESWAGYFGRKQEDLKGIGVYGDPGVEQAVIKDAAGIGYNNIVYVFDPQTKKQVSGVRVVPIDFNDNGAIDPEENFYDALDSLIEAIRTGKYPSPPARDLYFVTHGRPVNKMAAEFIRWVLTEGQPVNTEAGYIQIVPERIPAEVKKLD